MASEQFQPLQGMSDLAPPEIYLWQKIEGIGRDVLSRYGFSEIRTPLLERTEVFTRSIGDTTDVVQKEMYSFVDRGKRDISLRPEGTAGVMRYIANGGQDLRNARLYYLGPMFRYERPQKGRKRQHVQLGVESLGDPNPASDVECLALHLQLLNEWGLPGWKVQLNTRGMPEDRSAVADGLRGSLQSYRSDLCEDCERRFDQNILRVLDCKNERCREIVAGLPPVTDWMSQASRDYLDQVKRLLDLLEIPATVNPCLIRGLDYYVHTIWEITHPALGAQDSLAGGGRYRIQLGNKTVDGVGFGMGLERVIMALTNTVEKPEDAYQPPDVWIVSLGDKALEENLIFAQTLRMRGIKCGMELAPRSMKAQMRSANRAQAPIVLIRGQDELEKGLFQLKNMEASTQEELEMQEVLERLLSPHAL